MSFLACIIFVHAAISQDTIYTVNNWFHDGISQHLISPTTGIVNNTQTYATGSTDFVSTAIGMNSGGHLYAIPEITNTGEFEVFSIPAYPTTSQTTLPVTPTTPVLTGQIPSNNNRIFFRRLGIAPDNWAYMIVAEENTNIIHFAKFLTAANGTASNFTYIGTISLNDGPSTNFYNGDLAFDALGTMYVLVNADQGFGTTKIYKASSATLAAATGAASITQLTYVATVYTPTGDNFAGAVTGLAFASNGNLYLTAQNPAAPNTGNEGIFLINKDELTGNVIASATNFNADQGMADIASHYYPTQTFLPVNYNHINARIINGNLEVKWQTAGERNNDRFDIEISKDGVQFTKIGSHKSKASNGNSDNALNYEFAISLADAKPVLALGISLALLLLIPVTNRRQRMMAIICITIFTGVFAASCKKSGEQIDVDNTDKVYVRLVQYDINGKKEVSKTITAYKAD